MTASALYRLLEVATAADGLSPVTTSVLDWVVQEVI